MGEISLLAQANVLRAALNSGVRARMRSWTFLLFPLVILCIVWPMALFIRQLFFPTFDISGFGGPWDVPFVLLFWLTPFYLFVRMFVCGAQGRFRAMRFTLASFILWVASAAFVIIMAFGCVGGGCGQSHFVEIFEETLFIAFLVFLLWLAHRPEKRNASVAL